MIEKPEHGNWKSIMLSVKDTAARLNVSTSTVYSLIKCGQLKSHRIGIGRGVIRVSEADISDFLHGSVVAVQQPRRPSRVRLEHIKL